MNSSLVKHRGFDRVLGWMANPRHIQDQSQLVGLSTCAGDGVQKGLGAQAMTSKRA